MHVSAFIWSLSITINKDGWCIYISFSCRKIKPTDYKLPSWAAPCPTWHHWGGGVLGSAPPLRPSIQMSHFYCWLILSRSRRIKSWTDSFLPRAFPKDGIKPLTLLYFLCCSEMENATIYHLKDLKGALAAQQYHHSDKTRQSENTAWLLPLIQMRTCSEYLTED